MRTLTIHTTSDEQETAIRSFLDALHVDYQSTEETDDTTYLLSSEAKVNQLQKSIEQEKNGGATKLGLDDIWKL